MYFIIKCGENALKEYGDLHCDKKRETTHREIKKGSIGPQEENNIKLIESNDKQKKKT